jgi:hypothetical protein
MREIKLERRPADCERGIVEKQISRGGEKKGPEEGTQCGVGWKERAEERKERKRKRRVVRTRGSALWEGMKRNGERRGLPTAKA